MSRLRKGYEKARRNRKGVRYEDLDAMLKSAGFEVRQPSGGSSHYFYKKGALTITIPKQRPLPGGNLC